MSKDNSLLEFSTGQLFTELLKRIDFDGMDPRTFSLAELYRAIPGAEWPVEQVETDDLPAVRSANDWDKTNYRASEELYRGETRWNIIKIGLYLLLVLWLAWAAGWHIVRKPTDAQLFGCEHTYVNDKGEDTGECR